MFLLEIVCADGRTSLELDIFFIEINSGGGKFLTKFSPASTVEPDPDCSRMQNRIGS